MTTIRPASLPDLPLLASIWYEQRLLQVSKVKAAPSKLAWIEAAAEWVKDRKSVFRVAQVDEQIAGYVVGNIFDSGWLQAPIGRIVELGMDAHRYRAGVTRELVDTALSWFRMQQIYGIQITMTRGVTEDAFWRALGAQETRGQLWLQL